MRRYVTVDAEVDLSEIQTCDLVEELKSRDLDEDYRRDFLGDDLYYNRDKLNLFIKAMGRYSLLELETMFSELAFPAVACKEQLKLPL